MFWYFDGFVSTSGIYEYEAMREYLLKIENEHWPAGWFQGHEVIDSQYSVYSGTSI